MESDAVHARGVIMREAKNAEDCATAERGWLDWLDDCGDPGDRRRRHQGARPPHPRRRGDARRDLRGRDPGRGGPRADRRGALDEGRRPRPHGDAVGAGRPRRRRAPRRRHRHRDQALDRPPAPRARLQGDVAALRVLGRGRARPRPRPRLPRERPRRPGRSRLRRHDRARARRQAAGLRHLPRPSAALPGDRARDVQAPVRPPRHQPSGQGPRHRSNRDHFAEPRLRRRRAARRDADGDRRADPLGDRLRDRRALPPEPLRPHGRGADAARRPRRHRPVPPRGRPRSARRPLPVRPLPRARRCLGATTSRRSC